MHPDTVREATPMPAPDQFDRFATGEGFVAALDQSGGSTPKALAEYGVDKSSYSTDGEMFDLIHGARQRVITSPAFTGGRVLAAILFEGTLDRDIDGVPTADYLWNTRGVVPLLKIDKGLQEEAGGVQLMKDIPGLDDLLAKARTHGIFGTKERSVVHTAAEEGIAAIVDQQFALGARVFDADLVPVLEPEVSINAEDKAGAEEILKREILRRLDSLGERRVALKLTIPTVDDFYSDLVGHPNVVRVLALSGGYPLEDAAERLTRNPGVIASFSRALLGGLTAGQSEAEFDATLARNIDTIYRASVA